MAPCLQAAGRRLARLVRGSSAGRATGARQPVLEGQVYSVQRFGGRADVEGRRSVVADPGGAPRSQERGGRLAAVAVAEAASGVASGGKGPRDVYVAAEVEAGDRSRSKAEVRVGGIGLHVRQILPGGGARLDGASAPQGRRRTSEVVVVIVMFRFPGLLAMTCPVMF